MVRKVTIISESWKSCLFLKISGKMFAELILQHLSFDDLMKLNCAITNHGLRMKWWLSNEKKPLPYAEEVLKYAWNDKIFLSLAEKQQIKNVIRLGLRSSHWQIHFSGDIDTPTFRKFLEYGGNQLSNLQIWSCREISKLRCITNELEPYFKNLKSLTCGDMSSEHMSDGFYSSRWRESLLAKILQYCFALESLEFYFQDSFSHSTLVRNAIMQIIANNQQLKLIGMKYFPISLEVVQSLEQCSQLTSLSLMDARNTPHNPDDDLNYIDIVESLTIVVPKLTALTLNSIIRNEDEEFRISRSLEILSACSSLLITLDLSDSYKLPVDDACINMISSRCCSLENLNVSLDDGVYNESYASEWGKITDPAIVQLSTRCRGLKTIQVRRNFLLTGIIIDALLQNCLNIQEIDIFLTSTKEAEVRIKRTELKYVGRNVMLMYHPYDRRDYERKNQWL